MKLFSHVGVFVVGLLLAQANSTVFAAENFSEISRMNAFRLSRPKPEPRPQVIQLELPKVSLQGLATLLGTQALLKIQTKSQPVAIEVSCVLGEGQSRDGVEVLRIDMESETVWLNNHGEPQVLTLKR
jgi:hypothetical protein